MQTYKNPKLHPEELKPVTLMSIIGGFAKRAHPARARYLNVNLARRNRDLQPGGKEIEGGGRGGGGGGGGGEK